MSGDVPGALPGLYTVSRLLAGLPTDIALVAADDPLADLVQLLAGTNPSDRHGEFRTWVANHPDGRELTVRMLQVDPHGDPDQPLPAEDKPPTPEQERAELEAAQALVADIGDKAKADPGVPFQPETLGALALIKERDAPGWARAREALKRAGIGLRDLDAALKRCRASQSGLRVVGSDFTGQRTRTAGSMLADAPIPDLVIPHPYFLNEEATGIVTERMDPDIGPIKTETIIAHAPLVLSGRLRDADEGTEAWLLGWRRTAGWRSTTVNRGVALDARQLITLADAGAPVHSGNTRDLVEYLDALEAANQTHLPAARISSHLGFQGANGEHGFLVGRQLILPSGEMLGALNLADLPPEDWREDYISFRGAAGGDEQIADAYRAEGTLDGWRKAVGALAGHPRALAGFYASFAPVILAIVRAPNFVLDIANRTSTGKTTTMRVGASVWGNPDERSPDSIIGSWDATRVWQERAAATVNALPLFLDDTKRARDPKLIAEMLYAVANGRGRGRGSPKGLAKTRAWRTVLISTGEAPATSFTQDGGTRMRTLTIRGGPFGTATDETRRAVELLNLGVLHNFGHAGPAFVRWLYENRSDWDELGILYRSAVESFAERANSAEAGRLAQYAAVLTLTATLVHQALDLPWVHDDPLVELWNELAAEASDAAGDLRALRDVISWAYSHEDNFYGREVTDRGTVRIPTAGWAGRWERHEWEYLALFPTVLDKVLRDLKYEPEAILSGWQERGWLVTEAGRGRTKQVRVGGNKTRMIAVSREAVDATDD